MPLRMFLAQTSLYSFYNMRQYVFTDIRNCESQRYDNISNISGNYSGLPAHIKPD